MEASKKQQHDSKLSDNGTDKLNSVRKTFLFDHPRLLRVPDGTRKLDFDPEDFPRGYPKVSDLLDSDESFLKYRRFQRLHSQLLLHKQNELRQYEADLLALDAAGTEDTQDLPRRPEEENQIDKELEDKWISNLSMHFRDKQESSTSTKVGGVPSGPLRPTTFVQQSQTVQERGREQTLPGRWAQAGARWRSIALVSQLLSTRQPTGAADRSVTVSKELPMLVKKTVVAAQHDTGAEGNIIAKKLTKQLGLSIEPLKAGQGVFQLADGKIIKSIGQVSVDCAFALDRGVSMKCSFYVWDKVAGSGMIMGRAFLKATKTLSSFRHRLRNCIKTHRFPMLREISSTTNDLTTRLLCTIDGTQIYVNPDTGSELDVMSARHTQQEGYYVDREQRKRVQLGDGTIVTTIGQVSNVRVTLGDRILYKTFDVLPGLSSDIILGETTLDELDAYTQYEDCFADLDFGPRNYEMNIIVDLGSIASKIRAGSMGKTKKWLVRSWSTAVNQEDSSSDGNSRTMLSLAEQVEDNDQREMWRHDAAEKSIAALAICNPAAAAQARTIENEKRRLYEIERQALLQGTTSTTVTQGS